MNLKEAIELERQRQVDARERQRIANIHRQAWLSELEAALVEDKFSQEKGFETEVSFGKLSLVHERFIVTATAGEDALELEYRVQQQGRLMSAANALSMDNRTRVQSVDDALIWIAQKAFEYLS